MITRLFSVLVILVSDDPLEGHATAKGFHRLCCSFTNSSDETLLNGQSRSCTIFDGAAAEHHSGIFALHARCHRIELRLAADHGGVLNDLPDVEMS